MLLGDILDNLVGGADDDKMTDKYSTLNVNNEQEVREVIKEMMKPDFEAKVDSYKNFVKNTIAYYLITDEVNFELVFEARLPPFYAPDNAKDFYIWTWKEFFGENENYKTVDISNFEVNNDHISFYKNGEIYRRNLIHGKR